jgi:hypothetical protein
MNALSPQDLFGFANRALDVRVDIETAAEPEDLTEIVFRAVNGSIEKTGLSAESGGSGLLVDVALTDEDLDIWPGTYRWELVTTVNATRHTFAFGWLTVAPEVTEESSSS